MWNSITFITFILSIYLAIPLRAAATASVVISDISKDIIAAIGEDIQFNCTVKNVGSMSVSWAKYIDGSDAGTVVLSVRNILSIDDPRYSIMQTKDDRTGAVTYIFGIKAVEANDMGAYECQVIASAANKVTEKTNLFVKYPPIISDELPPKSAPVREGHSLEVTCHANGFPKPTISWRREDNTLMPYGGNFYAGPTLHIEKIHRLDRGAYYCVADNGVGDPIERMIRFEVEFPPQIITQRPKIAQALSYPTRLVCSIQGYPAPTVAWYRNGVELQTDSHYEIENMAPINETTKSVLRILSVRASDYGDYYCKATNELGLASARVNLFRHSIPVPFL